MVKYAVITGASSGIGEEFAKCLARKGYSLVLVARREDRLRELAARITKVKKNLDCRVIVADLSRREECERLVTELRAIAAEEDTDIEVFINNAGFGDCGSFYETSLDKDLSMIDVNVKAVHALTKQMLQFFREKNSSADRDSMRGYILNVASSAGLLPAGPYMATYYATKAYVTSLTQAVAEELRLEAVKKDVNKKARSDIYVGCLCPGPVNTEFNDVADVEFALPGISPKYCAGYAVRQMFRRKTVIVPKLRMRLVTDGARMLPRETVIRMTAGQQSKKLTK